jgi:hypothetical protein
VSTNPKTSDRGDQLFSTFVRTNEPPKPASPPPGGGGKPPDPEPATPPPAPHMGCSECRAPMRDRYFALNERPICAKCRPKFVQMIERGTGPTAFRRALLHGLATGLVGAAVLGMLVLVFPFFRVLIVPAIGYAIGKRVMAAVDGYGGRRYQILAVSLTYFAVGLGSLVPAFNEAHEAAERRRAIQADTTRRLATQGKAINEEFEAYMAEQAAINADDAVPDSASAEEAPADTPAVVAKRATSKEPQIGIGTILVAILTLPVLAMLAFGLYAGGFGLFTLGFAMYKAWQLTDGQGLDLQLRGPFRVGTGPIQPAT